MILYKSNFKDLECQKDYIKNGEGEMWFEDNKLFLDDSKKGKGLTVWNKNIFTGNLKISFCAKVLEPCLASNVNFFFMGKKTNGSPLDILEFSGSYQEYHEKADLYIVTLTGDFNNINGKSNIGYSRMRKDPGFNLINETYDIKSQLNVEYNFEILKKDMQIDIYINKKLIHSYIDNCSYQEGLVGFRTYYTKLYFENLKIEQL